jgi:hypothetical protein
MALVSCARQAMVRPCAAANASSAAASISKQQIASPRRLATSDSV